MSELFYGSICVTEILDKIKQHHPAFTKANNGKIYANISVWLNDTEDKYGNVMSLQLSSKKDETKVYIGNCKKSDIGNKPISNTDVEEVMRIDDDLPF
jgi:hypothetical protein